jgi:hypothetical protein
VKPYINKTYRTLAGKDYTTIIGLSLRHSVDCHRATLPRPVWPRRNHVRLILVE